MSLGGGSHAFGDSARSVRELRTPAGHGSVLIDPPAHRAAEVLAINRQRLNVSVRVAGQPLADLRCQARAELLAAAATATRAYSDAQPVLQDAPLFVAGHQPGLFHPGVWFKNFVLDAVAHAQGGTGVNLQIDGDTIKAASVRVPVGGVDEPRVETVEFDAAAAEMPWEERPVIDAECLASFAPRATAAIADFVREPVVGELWPRVLARLRDASGAARLGSCLATGRHRLERDWGLKTLEVAHSDTLQLPTSRLFLADLMLRAEEFRAAHNEALAEYRRRYHVRSANHPVSELAAESDWLETPLWVWTAQRPQRRRLFVRATGDRLWLADRTGWQEAISTSQGLAGVAAGLADLEAAGIKVRTRALLTTLLARLLWADAFIHGIGGGKYDRLTDRLIERFYGVEPPEFFVATATWQLPLARPLTAAAELQAIDQQLRELTYHPERWLTTKQLESAAAAIVPALIAEKQRWLDRAVTRANARQRCHAIRRLNESLQPAIVARRAELHAARGAIERGLRAAAVLGSREYAYCLFPIAEIRHFLLEMSRASA
ncbi:MAG: hypothetical protein K1X74_14455 [Pirellulales bacterium]|nr:hypothetical protein [Pirellulales bacterium]